MSRFSAGRRIGRALSQDEHVARGVRQLRAMREAIADAPAQPQLVQKTCPTCARPFNTANPAQHVCTLCAPDQKAA